MAYLATRTRPLPTPHFYVFDLETVAPAKDAPPREGRIWDIAVCHWRSRRVFTALVDPQLPAPLPPPPHRDLFPVTHAYLRKNGAQPFAAVADALLAFVADTCNSVAVPVAMVAHGCHLLDKPVLERAFARLGRTVPGSWYFYDTLPFFRKAFPRRRRGYSLKALHTAVMGRPPPTSHRAVADTAALLALLDRATGGNAALLVGGYYPPLLTPLQTVRYIGSQAEHLLHVSGYTCVEDLVVLLAKTCGLDVVAFQRYLETACSISPQDAPRIANSMLTTLLRRTGARVDAAANAAAANAAAAIKDAGAPAPSSPASAAAAP